MQNDQVIWDVIGPQGFCSFKRKIETTAFCQNRYNVTGLCNRSSCPLANGRYATVLEKNGKCYLYMKTVERAHTPSKLWEVVRLKKDYLEALQQIDEQLQYWPDPLINKRFTKLTQMLIRMRKMKLNPTGTKLVTIPQKRERVEKKREQKAFTAALVDNKIKAELLERLKKGLYDKDGILNMETEFYDVLEEAEPDIDNDEGIEEGEGFEPYVEDASDIEDLEYEIEGEEEETPEVESEEEDSEEEELPKHKRKTGSKSVKPKKPPKKPKKGDAKVSIEFEEEAERNIHQTVRDW